jgi:hypothetical protein
VQHDFERIPGCGYIICSDEIHYGIEEFREDLRTVDTLRRR